MHKKKLFKEYRWAFSTQDLLEGIGYHGPAVIGVPWYSGMFNTDSDGFIQPTGMQSGGHAILAKAINVKKGYVTLHNSWGKNWGMNGDCKITFDDLDKILNQRGEAVFLVKRTAMFHEAEMIK